MSGSQESLQFVFLKKSYLAFHTRQTENCAKTDKCFSWSHEQKCLLLWRLRKSSLIVSVYSPRRSPNPQPIAKHRSNHLSSSSGSQKARMSPAYISMVLIQQLVQHFGLCFCKKNGSQGHQKSRKTPQHKLMKKQAGFFCSSKPCRARRQK